jgi:FMN phosphatase YigB (HAD superfamily)
VTVSLRVDAVTFDYWNTLVHEEPGHLRTRRIGAWLGILDEAGVAVTSESLHELFERSWEIFAERWRANDPLHAHEAAAMILAELGHDLPSTLREALIEAFVRAGDDAELHLVDGVPDVLGALDAAGVRIGIICDVGMTPSPALRAHLARFGVLQHFDHWSFSDEVGVYKPDARIFEHAYEGLGRPDPIRIAHVGDLRRTDVAGARAAGWTSVRFAGIYDDPGGDDLPEGDLVIADHRHLLDALAG